MTGFIVRVSLASMTLACALIGLAGCGDRQSRHAAERPNVLLVVLDTTRNDFVGRHDLPQPTTPRIDRLAAEGVRYPQAYSTANWTLPAHGTLFTGLYPSQTGANAETMHLPQGVETLAERLQAEGWATYAASANPWIARERGFDQGFGGFVEAWRDTAERRPGPPAEDVAAFIRESVERGEPFFAFVNFNTAHLPYNPDPESARRFVDAAWPADRLRELSRMRGMFRQLTGEISLSPDDFAMLRQLYAAEVHMADRLLGTVLDAVEQAGVLDDTVIIVTSDHGENLGEHGRMGHGLCRHETTLRVPLVVRYPARFPAGVVRRDLVSLVDVAPTILDLTGVTRDDERVRIEAASLARADEHPARAFVVAESARPLLAIEELNKNFPWYDASQFDHRTRVVREGRYKLIWDVGHRTRLYDLEADPGELVDRLAELPDVEQRLLSRLRDWMSAIDESGDTPRFDTDDPETLERLRSLGYIQ